MWGWRRSMIDVIAAPTVDATRAPYDSVLRQGLVRLRRRVPVEALEERLEHADGDILCARTTSANARSTGPSSPLPAYTRQSLRRSRSTRSASWPRSTASSATRQNAYSTAAASRTLRAAGAPRRRSSWSPSRAGRNKPPCHREARIRPAPPACRFHGHAGPESPSRRSRERAPVGDNPIEMRADDSTPGNPAPGCVPAPTRYSLSTVPRSRCGAGKRRSA